MEIRHQKPVQVLKRFCPVNWWNWR